MYLEIYPDIIFILNCIINFILLSMLKAVSKKATKVLRLIGASATGALVAVVVGINPWLPSLIRHSLLNVVALILMIWISFRPLKRAEFIKQMVMLYLITYFVGGFLYSAIYQRNSIFHVISIGRKLNVSNIPIHYVLVGVGLIMILFRFGLMIKNRYMDTRPIQMKVELMLEENIINTIGFLDTGNCLYDPVLKKPVILVEATILENLLTPELRKEVIKAQNYLDGDKKKENYWDISSEYLHRFRFIPYQSIGKKGMLIGIILDKVIIHTGTEAICNEKVIAAISNLELSTRNDYHVILHQKLL